MNVLFSLIMVLLGFALAFCGLITVIETSHYPVGILLLFGGMYFCLSGVPKHE